MTDHWLDHVDEEPSPYLDRDAPRCRSHPSELGTNCRLCRSEAIADPDREPENVLPAEFRNRPGHLAPVIPINPPHRQGGELMPETFEEWRVTGTLVDPDEPYEFTWSPARNPHLGDSEVAARNFVNLFAGRFGTWTDGPHVTRRTVTVTDWEPA